jgi:hypothetical protein
VVVDFMRRFATDPVVKHTIRGAFRKIKESKKDDDEPGGGSVDLGTKFLSSMKISASVQKDMAVNVEQDAAHAKSNAHAHGTPLLSVGEDREGSEDLDLDEDFTLEGGIMNEDPVQVGTLDDAERGWAKRYADTPKGMYNNDLPLRGRSSDPLSRSVEPQSDGDSLDTTDVSC